MEKPIIEATNLTKLYRLGSIGASSVRETLDRFWMRLRGRETEKNQDDFITSFVPSQLGPEPNTFWALKDLTFSIQPGEVVGLIGHNGAGKSTLLKVLSRITEPTSGRAVLRGRVTSLLEVGTGFHPELSGRENIFLNGAMLGMKTAEIARKFDEIVDFAQVQDFIDTPVKRYSSGMYVRLAFAVAAHLEPEILIVDEVLAVGDSAFQKKCLGKMDSVAKGGRTVIVVSHNMTSILSLCSRAMHLKHGQLVQDGTAREVVRDYLEGTKSQEIVALDERKDRGGDGSARMVSMQLESADSGAIIRSMSRLKISITYQGERPIRHPRVVITVYDYSNTGLFVFNSDAVDGLPETIPASGTVTCVSDPINLTTGRCYLSIAFFRGDVMSDYVSYAAYFDVEADEIPWLKSVPPRDWVVGLLKHNWSLEKHDAHPA